ncbi:SEC62 family protein [Megaselia abdita]
MKKNVKTKKTKFLSHNVEYFSSGKTLDALMNSKFAEGDEPFFKSRENAIEFLDVMLEHKFFHRARKVPVYPEGKLKANEKEIVKEDKPDKTKSDSDNVNTQSASEDVPKSKDKRKRKIRLDMHSEQVFVDGSEAYVWIYDPIPIHYWIFGLILLLGAILICLFPLWPPFLRKGVYYLSVLAAGFLVFILALVVIRFIVFIIVYLASLSKLHFWIFPNLTEDVGFLASFWPLYEAKYENEAQTEKKMKRKKKDKESDNEDDIPDIIPLEPETIENIKEHDDSMILRKRESDNKKSSESSHSESESEASRSSTGKDFEIVDPNDV